ncbi:hypothetical protein [Pedobacter sp.]|jgi:hypothetical protein|uniref:hypothetical protein n=1 Tax=Pedobacter sp. TaxID=1411316 RepID=UPI002BBBCDE4|nr:hypothetical protein [Pedobacter sp.]HWW43165.1 hypothetical protein [Pedobacter sp.]
MKQFYYLLLLPILLFNSSCTMIIKGLGKSVANHYDDHKDLNLSKLSLLDGAGHQETLGKSFYGKTVYLYVWNQDVPPDDQNSDYKALKQRFQKYNDVVFINVYTGTDENKWKKVQDLKNEKVKAYRLVTTSENNTFRNLTDSVARPQIIGKDGTLLGFRGPTPADHLIVDYALYQARDGIDATQATKTLIRGINSKVKFKNQDLLLWYEDHFGKKPDEKLNISISNNN